VRAWRWPARLVILAIVVFAIVLDNRVDPPVSEIASAEPLTEPGNVRPPGVLASTWFCPVVQLSSDELDGGMASTLRIANTGPRTVPVTLTLMSPTTVPVSTTVNVLAGSVVDVDTSDLIEADRVAATIEAPGGGIAVTRRLTSQFGEDIAPCSPGASASWVIAAGDTQRDAAERIVIFNPFPDDAIVDVVFATEVEAGAFQSDLSAIIVPPRGVVSVDLGELVRRRDQVSVYLVARAGRMVVDRVQIFDGSEGRIGMAVGLGSVATSTRWYQPGVIVDTGTVANIHIYNPNDVPAEIDVAAESGASFATSDPIALTVPARDTVVVSVVATGSREVGLRLEVDPGLPAGILVESANGVEVVADIEIEVEPVEIPTTTALPTTTTPTTTTPTTTTPTTTTPTPALPTTTTVTTTPETTAPAETTATTASAPPETTATTTSAPPETTAAPPPPVTAPPFVDPLLELRDPRAQAGLAHSVFISNLSRTWLLIAEGRADVLGAGLIHNPGPNVAEILISRLDGTLIDRLTVQPGASFRFPLTLGIDAVVVESSVEVAASTTAERVGGVGVMLASGFPLSR